MKSKLKWALLPAVLAVAAAPPHWAQAQNCTNCGQDAAEGSRTHGGNTGFDNRPFPQTAPQTAEERQAAKWEDIQRDTEKLAQLTKELQDEVAKTDKGKLSLDVVRKADAIEKLSKSIRDRMKQS